MGHEIGAPRNKVPHVMGPPGPLLVTRKDSRWLFAVVASPPRLQRGIGTSQRDT